MRAKLRTTSPVSRTGPPLDADRLSQLRDGVAEEGGVRGLRALFLELNHTMRGSPEANGGPARDRFLEFAVANPAQTVAALRSLLGSTALRYGDPLVDAVFESARKAPALLAFLAEVAEAEKQLVQLRVRMVEALVTRSPGVVDAATVGLGAQPALRFLNSVLDEQEKGPAGSGREACAHWAESFGVVRDFYTGNPPVMEWLGEALGRLATVPRAPETLRLMVRILRANLPLPAWHPATWSAAPVRPWAGDAVAALIVDKAVQVVLGAAAARWHGGEEGGRPGRPDIQSGPFNERALEAALTDAQQPPCARAMAASLLRILAHATPAVRPSPRADLYASLLLAADTGAGEFARQFASAPPGELESHLDHLIEALADDGDAVRRVASEACQAIARQQPAAFQPRHYTMLLPLLSHDDPTTRRGTMTTFQALAGFRSGRVAAVVDTIAARLHGDAEGEEEEHARRDLESALGITMDRLVDDVEQLQREVHALETRRRELLRYMETQAVRVGEEIHLEVLNTLTGYLATAVDEEDYSEAKRRLDGLVAELRRIMNNLYPRDLETEGFLRTLASRLRDTQAQMSRVRPGCAVELECAPGVTDASLQECLAQPAHLVLLYRIVLEAVVNARKHAGGTHIGVSVRPRPPAHVEIAVSDDGAGGGGPFGEGVGMALMRQRAEEIGAEIAYTAGPETGTTVVIRLPRVPRAADPPGGVSP